MYFQKVFKKNPKTVLTDGLGKNEKFYIMKFNLFFLQK